MVLVFPKKSRNSKKFRKFLKIFLKNSGLQQHSLWLVLKIFKGSATAADPFGKFKRLVLGQVAAQCGKHSVNNLLGGPEFSVGDFMRAAQECADWEGDPIEEHANASGNYSLSVVERVLSFHQNSTTCLNPLQLPDNIFEAYDQDDEQVFGLIIHSGQHYISIRHKGGAQFCLTHWICGAPKC